MNQEQIEKLAIAIDLIFDLWKQQEETLAKERFEKRKKEAIKNSSESFDISFEDLQKAVNQISKEHDNQK